MHILYNNKCFPVKVPLVILLRSTMIGCTTLSMKERLLVDLHSLIVVSAEGSIKEHV